MRLIFMGTPDFSVPALEALIAAGHDVSAVYTQPPRRAGRGKKLRPSPIESVANLHEIPIHTPLNLKSPEEYERFKALGADMAVVVAYGLILPQNILDAPLYGCLNIHASILPHWRGAAPIQRAIMAGDKETGISIMRMEAGLDTGPVLMREATHIGATETSGELHHRLAGIGASMICKTVDQIKTQIAEPQCDELASYAPKIDKTEARIDWSAPAEIVARKINALSPFPGAWSEIDGHRIKFLRAEASELTGKPGSIVSLTPLQIGCGAGAVSVLDLQRAGRAAQTAEDFLLGFHLQEGQRFT